MSERVLVATPYPTMSGPESAAGFALVQRLAAAGDDVVVVSPRPSAAHHHADAGSPRGAARLASLAGGRDRLVLRLDAAALQSGSDSPRLLPARLALGAAVRRATKTELILDRVPSTVARRWASLVVAPAERVTVASDAERDALVRAGVAAGVLNVDPDILPPAPDRVLDAIRGRGPSPEARGSALSAASIEATIRRRAAEAQTPLEAGLGPGQRGLAAKNLRSIPPLERPQIRSRNPGHLAIKRVQLKLLSWMFDWVIQHVNRLHQATIDAVETLDDQDRNARS